MEKVLLAIDGVQLNNEALNFACYICRLTKSRLIGVFLENLVAEQRQEYKTTPNLAYADWPIEVESDGYRQKVELIEQNIVTFKNRCCEEGVNCVVHRDRSLPESELVAESRYADLLIVDAQTSFKRKYEGSPSDFARQILKESECPVVIAPQTFTEIDEIVFAYDSSASSIFAIKQFTYLLPEFKKYKLTILNVNESGQWQDCNKIKFSEWLNDHYDHVNYQARKGEPETGLLDFLIKKQNQFVILGSFGRTAFSNLIHKSKAEILIETITQPIFITHF